MSGRLTRKVQAYLKQLEKEGRLTPDLVVEDAKRKESPLHNWEGWGGWKMKEAAEEHWRNLARGLIRSIQFIVTTTDRPVVVRGYMRDPDVLPREQSYVPTEQLFGDPALARRTVEAECDRILGQLKRARDFACALDMEAVFDELIAKVSSVRVELQPKPPGKEGGSAGRKAQRPSA